MLCIYMNDNSLLNIIYSHNMGLLLSFSSEKEEQNSVNVEICLQRRWSQRARESLWSFMEYSCLANPTLCTIIAQRELRGYWVNTAREEIRLQKRKVQTEMWIFTKN